LKAEKKAMHEYLVTKEIIRIATDAALRENAPKVKKIALVVGELSGYASECIQMYFNEIAKGTPCEGGLLDIKRVRPQLKCNLCGTEFDMSPLSFKCPTCGGDAHPTDKGNEFYVEYIEAE
jgi:hydrogenase nickel incorporation protein HypA/HybF